MLLQHVPGEIIYNRYRLLNFIGQGGIGTTYAAENIKTGEKVALKAVWMRQINDFKILELLEREARILAQLDHPGIPRYIDSFQVGKRRDRVFYLVQELAKGQSLATLVERGWHPDEAKVRRIAEHILEILIYLQQLTPPVFHRDIKPQNVIYRAGGQLFLVDFGAVQDVYHYTLTGGSTVVGTYGYMAPEQFRGKAVLGTDLYGLGATLIFLLTGRVPAQLPQRKLKIDFRSNVCIEQPFYNWIDRLIEPVADDRFSSAEEALAVLQGKQAFPHQTTTEKERKPANSPIALIEDVNRLEIHCPSVKLRTKFSQYFLTYILIWNSTSLFIIAVSFYSFLLNYVLFKYVSLKILPEWILTSLKYFYGLGILMTIVLAGFWALVKFLLAAIGRTQFKITPDRVQLERYFLGWRYKTIQEPTDEIIEMELKPIGLSMNKAPITVCTLRCRLRQYRFGCFLTEPEKEWLVAKVRAFLEKSRR